MICLSRWNVHSCSRILLNGFLLCYSFFCCCNLNSGATYSLKNTVLSCHPQVMQVFSHTQKKDLQFFFHSYTTKDELSRFYFPSPNQVEPCRFVPASGADMLGTFTLPNQWPSQLSALVKSASIEGTVKGRRKEVPLILRPSSCMEDPVAPALWFLLLSRCWLLSIVTWMYRTARAHPPSLCQVSLPLTLHLAPDLTGPRYACPFSCQLRFLCTPARTLHHTPPVTCWLTLVFSHKTSKRDGFLQLHVKLPKEDSSPRPWKIQIALQHAATDYRVGLCNQTVNTSEITIKLHKKNIKWLNYLKIKNIVLVEFDLFFCFYVLHVSLKMFLNLVRFDNIYSLTPCVTQITEKGYKIFWIVNSSFFNNY